MLLLWHSQISPRCFVRKWDQLLNRTPVQSPLQDQDAEEDADAAATGFEAEYLVCQHFVSCLYNFGITNWASSNRTQIPYLDDRLNYDFAWEDRDDAFWSQRHQAQKVQKRLVSHLDNLGEQDGDACYTTLAERPNNDFSRGKPFKTDCLCKLFINCFVCVC